jgi:hemolysin activation/secretion protein
VDQRLNLFPFAKKTQASDISFLGTGGILNLYLNAQKCSQIDLLLGLQPASNASGKAQLVGNAQLDLRNSFGKAERIFLQWQQLQLKSPRLNVAYAQPFMFGTSFGTESQFGLFKKDSSFLQIRASLALTHQGFNNHKTTLGFSFFQNTLLEGAADTNRLIQTQKMPDDIDSKSMNLMLGFAGRTTNHLENPNKGWEYQQTVWAGNRKVISNQTLMSVKGKESFVRQYYDSVGANTYQIRYIGSIQKYIPLGNYSVMMLGSQMGYYQSRHIFRTDLFQIGGNRLLRGFDEESIFANRYAVFTAEYRLQLSETGYAQLFTDIGFVNNQRKQTDQNTTYTGMGIGMVYPTENGRLRISLAVGKRTDVPFVLRQSVRIHLGYVNYF